MVVAGPVVLAGGAVVVPPPVVGIRLRGRPGLLPGYTEKGRGGGHGFPRERSPGLPVGTYPDLWRIEPVAGFRRPGPAPGVRPARPVGLGQRPAPRLAAPGGPGRR